MRRSNAPRGEAETEMDGWTQEQHTVAETFRASFGGARTRPLLLYGLGRNTEAILALCPEIKIAGVMGPDADAPVWHGMPVASAEDAVELGADVVIVARNSIVPIIHRRIAALETRGARIFRVNGQSAAAASRYANGGLPYWDETPESLKSRIGRAEFISFDIFDTLLARRVLHPEDIFSELERRLPWASGFCASRRRHQKSLGPAAAIERLYDAVGAELGWSAERKQAAMEAEWRLECETVYPRRDMLAAFQYAQQRSKPVWLLSDMYWPETRLRELLARVGLATSAPMLVSCEALCCKEDGTMFREYLRRSGAEPPRCLHVGDNRYADIEAAERSGIPAFRVYSGYSLLEESAAQSLLSREWEDAAALGEFTANRFASPFALHETRGRLPVDNFFELGRDFIAPLIDCWMHWLSGQLRESGVSRMLFPARDGFLIAKLYERLRQRDPALPPGIYFKASRRAVTVASIRTEADARELAERPFRGTVRDFFAQRFGVEVDDEAAWNANGARADALLTGQMPAILRNAEAERESYLRYLERLGALGDGVAGFFDFVAGGTVQHFYEKLTGAETKGFYFATMNLPNAFYREGEIAAPFGNITSYGESPLSAGYLMLESVLTDPDTTLVRVGGDGTPVFADGKNGAWAEMEQIQNGVLDYVSRRVESGCPPVQPETALAIWGLLFDGSCAVPETLRGAFRHEDGYDGASAEPCWQDGAAEVR